MGGSKRKRSPNKRQQTAVPAPPAMDARGPGFFMRIQSSYDGLARRAAPWRTLLEILAVVCIFALGVFCRLEDLSQWKEKESLAFYDGKPIHTTFDAWFYLSLAQNLIDGTYTQPDEKRGVPHSPLRPEPPPLISVLAAATAKATNVSLCWVGALLPAVLGPLLVVPLYLTGRFYGGVACGLLAALMSVLYPFYIVRSNVGRFDTDCLILAFSLGAAYLFMRFGLARAPVRYVYVCAGAAVSALFLWWWDQTPAAVAALTGLPLLVALVFYYRPSRREGLAFYGILACCAAAVLWYVDPALPLKIIRRLWLELLYITKEQSGDFPNVGKTISEQFVPELDSIIRSTTANVLSFLLAAAGFILLVWRRRAQVLFLLPFIIMSYLAFTTANRFILFMIPLVALGTGYAGTCIWRFLHRVRPLNACICTGIALLLAVPLYTKNTETTRMPKEPGFMVQAMYRIREVTPQDAVIWAWWDHGYALTYYARRATINDGSIHGGELTVFNAIPYAAGSFRLAANFMQFYVSRGIPGMRKVYKQFDDRHVCGLQFIQDVLRAGPEAARSIIEQAALTPDNDCKSTEDWLRFFFPGQKRPLYLVCDHLLNRTAYWWYWFGTWDTVARTGTHPRFRAHDQIHFDRETVKGAGGLVIDRATGTYLQNEQRVPLGRIDLHARGRTRTLNDYSRSGLHFEFNRDHRHGAIMDAGIADSVFSRLFIRTQPDTRYFKPVINSPPYFQLWKVSGDRVEK
ncbi:MAG: hypothetical protein FJ119_00090 [Deltaproteobacteria bacterium]|nr:hypothetical protein [Deltaproteobacteria bacterium]